MVNLDKYTKPPPAVAWRTWKVRYQGEIVEVRHEVKEEKDEDQLESVTHRIGTDMGRGQWTWSDWTAEKETAAINTVRASWRGTPKGGGYDGSYEIFFIERIDDMQQL